MCQDDIATFKFSCRESHGAKYRCYPVGQPCVNWTKSPGTGRAFNLDDFWKSKCKKSALRGVYAEIDGVCPECNGELKYETERYAAWKEHIEKSNEAQSKSTKTIFEHDNAPT